MAREPQQVNVNMPEVTIRHVIEKKPDPRPVRLWLVIMDADLGRRYQTIAVPVNGRQSLPLDIPMGFMTGDANDHRSVRIQAELEY